MKTREKIIDAAIELFNLRGTKNVTTNHIAAVIGISLGNLYYHFRSKQDIIHAIFEHMDAYGPGVTRPLPLVLCNDVNKPSALAA